MSALLAAALDYAANRLPVFPCVPNGKLPAIARGFHSATTNPETIKRYWRAPDRNVGIPTGSVSGFWVLDVDGDNGEANLFALEAEHGRLPPTREVITGGGGRHLWFKYTGPIQSSVGKIAPGVDVRGDGGYVIVPPSVHVSGREYHWSVDSADELATGTRMAGATGAREASIPVDRFDFRAGARAHPAAVRIVRPLWTGRARARDRIARRRAGRHT